MSQKVEYIGAVMVGGTCLIEFKGDGFSAQVPASSIVAIPTHAEDKALKEAEDKAKIAESVKEVDTVEVNKVASNK